MLCENKSLVLCQYKSLMLYESVQMSEIRSIRYWFENGCYEQRETDKVDMDLLRRAVGVQIVHSMSRLEFEALMLQYGEAKLDERSNCSSWPMCECSFARRIACEDRIAEPAILEAL